MKCAFIAAALLTSLAFAEDPKTYKPDDEGYIRNWLLLDPIKLTEDVSAHNEEQEKPVFAKDVVAKNHKPKAGEKLSVGTQDLTWNATSVNDAVLDLAQIFEGKDHDQCVFLGVVYLIADKDIENVRLSSGSDDSSVWKLNGKEITRTYASRGAEKDTDKSEAVTLKKGVNILSFAVIQGDGPTGAVARFIDKDDKPVKDVTVSLTPPEK